MVAVCKGKKRLDSQQQQLFSQQWPTYPAVTAASESTSLLEGTFNSAVPFPAEVTDVALINLWFLF